jgi:hypothetical protein
MSAVLLRAAARIARLGSNPGNALVILYDQDRDFAIILRGY